MPNDLKRPGDPNQLGKAIIAIRDRPEAGPRSYARQRRNGLELVR
jgi:hypothetical protein